MTNTTAIKFNRYNVTDGTHKARVWYGLDNRIDGRKVVTIRAKDYIHDLHKLFSDAYENNSDSMTDYFEKGTVRLFEDNPLYATARNAVEKHLAAEAAKIAAKFSR